MPPKRVKVGGPAPTPAPRPIQTLVCESCQTSWTRELKKGPKPRRCPGCSGVPRELTDDDVARRKAAQERDEQLARENAERRVSNLEASLKAGGVHLSQQPDKPRSYRLDWMLDRLDRIEESLAELRQHIGMT